MVDVDDDGVEAPLRLLRVQPRAGSQREEVAGHQAAPRVRGQRRGGRDQPAPVPVDHHVQRLHHHQRAHLGVLEHGPRGVAQPQPADDHVQVRVADAGARPAAPAPGAPARPPPSTNMLDIRKSSSSLTSKTSCPVTGSRRRRRLTSPIGVCCQSSSSNRVATRRTVPHDPREPPHRPSPARPARRRGAVAADRGGHRRPGPGRPHRRRSRPAPAACPSRPRSPRPATAGPGCSSSRRPAWSASSPAAGCWPAPSSTSGPGSAPTARAAC